MNLHRLRHRLRHRTTVCRAAVLLAFGSLSAACKPDAPRKPLDSATTALTATVDSAAPVPVSNGWNAAAGPVLLVAGPSPDEALVFFGAATGGGTSPLDTGAVDQGTATLLGRDGTRLSGTLELPAGNDNTECRVWPLRKLHAIAGSGTWSVGFVSGNVTAVPLDSVDALPARDSMALAAEASRLASAVTAATSPAFQGLRFTAHDVRRFEVAPGVQALAAQLTRHVNQEADPKEEQTLLIAERDSGVTTGPYQLAYAERSSGKEEEVSTSEVVAAVRFAASGQPSLIVARDGNEGLAYALLERSGPRRWSVKWTSGLAKCAE
ncbi:MAG: hypothetical protein ABIP93_10880 [Gemmatimonadaceae bacterium]